jgi:hypothetical protein
MFYVGMTIALPHEVLRVSLFAKLPPAFIASPELAAARRLPNIASDAHVRRASG